MSNTLHTLRLHVASALFVVLLGTLAAAFASPQDDAATVAARWAGHWKGRIEVAKLDFDVDLSFNAAAPRGDLSIPVQNLVDRELVDLVVDGDRVAFRIDGIPGEPAFDGTLDDGTGRIAGTFTQNGAKLSFWLERSLPTAELAQSRLAGFDDWLLKQSKRFHVPGVAVAVVWEGQVVLARGYGVADVTTGALVGADTLFAIGSTTKAFTTFAIAQAVEEGLLDWDEPVRTWLPELDLVDDMAEAQLTLRDMCSHRSGLPRHDLVWYANPDVPRAELVRRLAHLEPTAGLRETWQYNNLMLATAGVALERVTGQTWEQRVRSNIFEPLHMDRTAFGLGEVSTRTDVASAHDRKRGRDIVIATRDLTQIGPAGSIHSSANDMARWIAMLLEGGEIDGVRLLSAERLHELAEPVVVMPSIGLGADKGPAAYALGWMVDTVEGRLRVHHGGGIDGFTTQVELYPEARLGIFTVTNRASALTNLSARELAQRLLELAPSDATDAALTQTESLENVAGDLESAQASERILNAPPARPLESYVGSYMDAGYGDLVVRLDGGVLHAKYGLFDAPLEPWHFEVFRCGASDTSDALDGVLVQFQSDVTGLVTAVEVPLESSSTTIRFELQPGAALFDPNQLELAVGTYDLAGQPLRLERKGTVLTLIVPGQPPHVLVPSTHGRWRIKGADGYWVRLERNLSGAPVTLVLIQPNGVFRAERRAPPPRDP